MRQAKQFRMKLYYLQCKPFQFVVFGQVGSAVTCNFGRCRNIFQAKMSEPPRKIALTHNMETFPYVTVSVRCIFCMFLFIWSYHSFPYILRHTVLPSGVSMNGYSCVEDSAGQLETVFGPLWLVKSGFHWNRWRRWRDAIWDAEAETAWNQHSID